MIEYDCKAKMPSSHIFILEDKAMVEKIKNGITEMVFIIDKSGSMAGMEEDTVGGFKRF